MCVCVCTELFEIKKRLMINSERISILHNNVKQWLKRNYLYLIYIYSNGNIHVTKKFII